MRSLPLETSGVNSAVPLKEQYRVQWRRPGWSLLTSSKGRVFFRRDHMFRFVDKLRSRGPVCWIRVQARTAEFGPWRELGKGGRP